VARVQTDRRQRISPDMSPSRQGPTRNCLRRQVTVNSAKIAAITPRADLLRERTQLLTSPLQPLNSRKIDTKDSAPARLLTGQQAFSDYQKEKPGLFHKITAADLPKPYATKSSANFPKVVPKPDNMWPHGAGRLQSGAVRA
jgi:hypothetical protein